MSASFRAPVFQPPDSRLPGEGTRVGPLPEAAGLPALPEFHQPLLYRLPRRGPV